MSNQNTGLIPTKHPGGRPVGKRDSAKRVSPYAKANIKALYLAGHTIDDIKVALNVDNGNIIAKWANKENWNLERDKLLALSTTAMLETMRKSQQENFEGLKLIKDTSLDAIRKDPNNDKKLVISPRKYPEAANAFISALEIEYKMKMDALQVNFLNDLAMVLKEKIQDRQLLSEIGQRFREVLEKYQQKRLPEIRKGDNAS